MPVCPRDCAGNHSKKVNTREDINVPLDVWDNLTGKNYEIWRCDYCGFVWGEQFRVEAPAPYFARAAIGYFGGLSGQQGWHLTPDVVLSNYPDRKAVKPRRR